MTPRTLSINYQIKLYLSNHPHNQSDNMLEQCLCAPEELMEYFNTNQSAAEKYFNDIEMNSKFGNKYVVGAKLERIIKEVISEI